MAVEATGSTTAPPQTADPALTSMAAAGTGTAAPARAGRYWIEDWRPEDPHFWNSGGSRVALRNLVFSIFSEHIGFSIWTLWSVWVLFLGPTYHIDAPGKFLLTSLPALVGAVLRVPYTFAVAKFGGRNWTIVSAALLLIPCILAAIVLKPGVTYSTLLIVAAFAGFGGGNFASSMSNINVYYPDRLKGWALGLNAGGGNLGVAVVQLVGLLVLATAGAAHPRLMLAVYIPLVVLACLGAAFGMNNIAHVRNEKRGMRDVARDGHTWIIATLYIGTFGSFIGFGFAFGQVLQVQFSSNFTTAVNAAYLTFLGPLLGSLIRPVGGKLADRLGGARVSFWNFGAMAVAGALVLAASLAKSLPLFIIGFITLFVLSGLGNGSVYKMIPAIFTAKYALTVAGGDEEERAYHDARRRSGALIGLAGAIGAFGGVLVNVAFRQSFLATKTGNAAYLGFIAFYVLCFVLTWAVYLRNHPRKLAGV